MDFIPEPPELCAYPLPAPLEPAQPSSSAHPNEYMMSLFMQTIYTPGKDHRRLIGIPFLVTFALMPELLVTIDDGPSPNCAEFLAILAELGIQAMFFCVGKALVERPEFADLIIKRGHVLGNHSWSHVQFSRLTLAEAREEILRAEAVIDAAYARNGITRRCKVFRFPYGDQGFGKFPWRWLSPKRIRLQGLLRELRFQGPKAVLGKSVKHVPRLELPRPFFDRGHDWVWTLDPKDWRWGTRQPSEPLHKVAAPSRIELLLLHDLEQGTPQRGEYLRELADRFSFRRFTN